MPALLTPKQVAETVGTSQRTVSRWIADGKLTGVNIGSDARPRYRVAQQDLLLFLEHQRTTHDQD